jgi:cell division protein FtsQ
VRRVAGLALAIVAVGAGLKFAHPTLKPAVLAQLESLAAAAGLGLDQVVLIGHRYTADMDIFEAINLRRARSLLTFDSASTQARITELPWIAEASISRVFPNRLEVRVSERAPVAVWTRGPTSYLIDATGRRLSVVAADLLPALPRVSGADGDHAVSGLIALLATAPELSQRVRVAERVGGRRWTLWLEGGGSVLLPAVEEVQALAQASQLLAGGFTRTAIDLRTAGRVIVREGARASQAHWTGPARLPPMDRL